MSQRMLKVCDGIWCVDERLTIEKATMPFGLPRFLGTIQARMTVVKLVDGSLLVHSPVSPTDAALRILAELGPVGAIVAPNCQHTRFTQAYVERFPEAKVAVAPKAHKRRAGFDRYPVLDDDAPIAVDTLKQRFFAGHRSYETAFLHPSSRTLIVSDLAYNVREDGDLVEKMWMRLHGAYGQLALPRYHRKSVFDADAARRALADILAWDFDRIIMSHGHIVQSNGHAEFERIWSWL
jgi:hypothetical protein